MPEKKNVRASKPATLDDVVAALDRISEQLATIASQQMMFDVSGDVADIKTAIEKVASQRR